MANKDKRKELTTEERISKEKRRLKALFKNMDANKLKLAQALIDRAAFITVSLQDLEEDLAENGWTQEYQNGENQCGVKRAASADVHISLTKNLTSIMKQLDAMLPATEKKGSKLMALMSE